MSEEESEKKWQRAIEQSLIHLKDNHWDNDSRIYDVVYQGQSYPPKEVYRKAIDFFLEANPDGYVPKLGGGKRTNKFIQKHGFTVIGDDSFQSSPRICKMQMKSDADKKNYADEVLADNRITGHIDFLGPFQHTWQKLYFRFCILSRHFHYSSQ